MPDLNANIWPRLTVVINDRVYKEPHPPKLAYLAASCAVAFSSAGLNSFKIKEIRAGISVAKHLSTTINEDPFPISHPAPDPRGNFSPPCGVFAGRARPPIPDPETLLARNAAFGRFFAGFQF